MNADEIDWIAVAKEWLTIPKPTDFNINPHFSQIDVEMRRAQIITIPAIKVFGANHQIKVYDSPLVGNKIIDMFPSTVECNNKMYSNPLVCSLPEVWDDCYCKLSDFCELTVKVKTANGARFRAIESDQNVFGWLKWKNE